MVGAIRQFRLVRIGARPMARSGASLAAHSNSLDGVIGQCGKERERSCECR